MSKYLEFRLLEKKSKTKVIKVISKLHGSKLGVIKWLGKWRQYVFLPEFGTVFSRECLYDLALYIRGLRQDEK